MTECFDWDDGGDEVETLVRALGERFRASDDLRPRVLEAARLQCRERRARRWTRHLAMFVVLLAFVTADRPGWQDQRARPIGIVLAAGFDEFLSPTAVASLRSGDGDWRMLNAFTELRRQQAEVLRLAL